MLQLGVLSGFSVCSVPWNVWMCDCNSFSFTEVHESLAGFQGGWPWSPGCGQGGPPVPCARQDGAIQGQSWDRAGWGVQGLPRVALSAQEQLCELGKVKGQGQAGLEAETRRCIMLCGVL